ncbi:MAG: DNA repair protein RadA [Pseudomonadota bacterium]|nr:DNA repair protein RadA [Pseudomonadota bacterium]
MVKKTSLFCCQECKTTYTKWQGKCDSCQAWNSIVEITSPYNTQKGLAAKPAQPIEFVSLAGSSENAERISCGISEFDRVVGGGLTQGSAILVGGDPGIGKSTILLQIAAAISAHSTCAYVSGEESVQQVTTRAKRLGLSMTPVQLASANNIRDIAAALDVPTPPRLVIVDSIQTMYLEDLESAPGSVSQVRACADALIRLAKMRGFIVVLVGHVTKEGTIAGPRILEHMVDTVLYFEGERGHQFRLLRATKNRFGPTDEIGVFEMTGAGLKQVENPSILFLAERHNDVAGAAVFAGIEGTRPVLVEIQALVGTSTLGTPRRAVLGWDTNRLAMVLAVLETRCGLNFAGRDVYLNVAGGLKITEPAADLAVASALVSAILDQPLEADTVIFGEIGLAGEIRSVGNNELRLKEAAKLGFKKVWLPTGKSAEKAKRVNGDLSPIDTRCIQKLNEILRFFTSTGTNVLDRKGTTR